MEHIYIDLGERSYTIHIDSGLLHRLPTLLEPAEAWIVITDEVVADLYGQKLVERWNHPQVHTILLSGGEEAKNLQTVEAVLCRMSNLGVTRRSKILALGGGVVGDVAGFCASIYMRGIPYVQVPTTLLAQVDSSVGGKTGVNLPQGKNLVGSFYQPQDVYIDTATLSTLPRRHLISGLAEVIKYGVIYDYPFLGYLRRHFEAMCGLDDEVIAKVVTHCCKIKAQVVAGDEKEQGQRKILNFGHTIGHALERATGYEQYTHGEGVLFGMQVEARLAQRLGLIDPDYYEEIACLIQTANFHLSPNEISSESLLEGMQTDKKNQGGRISFILPSGKGKTTEVFMTKEEVSRLLPELLEL